MSTKYYHNSMSSRHLLATLLLIVVSLHNVYSSDWSYKDQELWSHSSPQCSGSKQSPIDINLHKTVLNTSLHLEFVHYDRPMLSFSVFNNYHSIQYNYIGDRGSAPGISGSALNNEQFILDHFHFHWGGSAGIGSEHSIDGKTYSMEMHLVHFNRKYKSLTEALGKPFGVAVVGVFIQIVKEDNPSFEEIQRIAAKVGGRDKSIHLNPDEPINLSTLLPVSNNDFFRYKGSLTTPPCTEPLEWVVLAHPISIGIDQINEFRKAKNQDTKELIANNFRKIQQLNDRIVQSSFETGSGGDDDDNNNDDHHKDHPSGSSSQTIESLSSLVLLTASSIVIGRLYR